MKTLTEAMNTLKEDRYYYGEVEHAKDMLSDAAEKIESSINFIKEKCQGLEDNEYSKEQFELLDQTITSLENIVNNINEVNSNLSNSFKNRIRHLTPEEKAEIERMQANGEI